MKTPTWLIGTAAVTALVLAGCSGNTGSGSGDTAGEWEMTEIKIGVLATSDAAALMVGDDAGIFEKYGLDPVFETAAGGAAIVPLVVSGQQQLGYSNVVSIFQATEEGLPLKIVAPSSTSWGDPDLGVNNLVVAGDSGITSAAELEGKTVAVNTLHNLFELITRVSVEKAGGDPDTVNFVEMPPPAGVAALMNGEVDALSCGASFCVQALAQGAVQIANSLEDVAPGEQIAVASWFTSQSQIDANPELFDRIQNAIFEVNAFATANPELVRAKVLEIIPNMDPEVNEQTILNNWPATIEARDLRWLGDAALAHGLITKAPAYDELLFAAE